MKCTIFVIVLFVYVIMGYFLMKRLDEFIKNNKRNNRK